MKKVFFTIAKDNGEIRTFLTINSSSDYLKLTHEINGWTKIEVIEAFCHE